MEKYRKLKTVGWFILWIISFQLIPLGTELMRQPSDILFILGILSTIGILGAVSYSAFNFVVSLFKTF